MKQKICTNTEGLRGMKLDISLRAKNGIDFIISAFLIWLLISTLWTLQFSAYDKSVYTFIIGGILLPLAFLLSKMLKTNWKIKDNPLQPLGLWLNFAQLFYFPFLFFVLINDPENFIMTFAIITGAHLFPYAWFYDEIGYAVCAGIISFGSFFMGLFTDADKIYFIPLFTTAMFLLLSVWLFIY